MLNRKIINRKNETVDFMVVYHKSNKMILLIQLVVKQKSQRMLGFFNRIERENYFFTFPKFIISAGIPVVHPAG